MFAAALLIAAGVLGVAPPLRDPLPAGAVVRLGHARMVVGMPQPETDPVLVASPEGAWLQVVFGRGRRYEAPSPDVWFRVADGRRGTPVAVPPGLTLERLFVGGARLFAKEGKRLLFPDARAETPSVVIEPCEGRLVFDARGRVCLRLDGSADGYVTAIWQGDLRGRGPVEWRKLAAAPKGFSWVVLSADGTRAAWMERKARRVRHRDLGTGKEADLPLGEEERPDSAALGPDGKTIALVAPDRMTLCDLSSGKRVRALEARAVYDMKGAEFLPDGSAVVIRRLSCPWLDVAPVDPRRPCREVPLEDGNGGRFAIMPCGRLVATLGGGGVVRLHDLHTGRQADGHSAYPAFLGVQLVGRHLAASWCERGLVVRWDIRTGREVSRSVFRAADSPSANFYEITFGPGARVACINANVTQYYVADLISGKPFFRGDAEKAFSMFDVSPGGDVSVMSSSRGRESRRLVLPGGETKEVPLGPFWGTRWHSPDGRFVAYDGGTRIALVEVATGRPRWEVPLRDPERGRIGKLGAFDLKRRRLVVAGEDGAWVLDLLTGRRLFDVGGAEFRAASASGRWIVSLENRRWRATVHDLHSATPAEPAAEIALAKFTSGLAFNADGSRLVTSHDDGTCLVWDVQALVASGIAPDLDAWKELGHPDPGRVVAALARLQADPAKAVRLLGGRLAPVPALPAARVAGWIDDLRADPFDVRRKAESMLARERESCEGPMRAALAKGDLEQRMRLARLLKPFDARKDDPAWLRKVRAVEVLERIATREARAVLTRLAGGAQGAALTLEARAALRRLDE